MESLFTEHQAFLETVAIILAITGPTAGLVIGYFKKKFACVPKLARQADVQDARTLRQSKALIILSYRIDDINNFQHPNNNKSNLGPEIETILKDENGKL